ncbi:MAG: endonuclease [Elusimicrobia bacterium]|nr:endonuclease [Elusimicrobiota bacterium]
MTTTMRNFKTIFAFLGLLLISTTTNMMAQSPSALDTLKSQINTDIVFDFPTPIPDFSYSNPKASTKLSGEELFQYLHAITGYGKIAADKSQYTTSKSYMYSKADNITCNGRPGIITFYSLICANGASSNGADYNELSDGNGDGTYNDEINVEHLWPQSAFNQSYPMRADLHHLRPTFTKPNNMRSNYPFAEVSDWDYSTSVGSKRGDQEFEPTDSVKGDVARAMLYFVVRYYDRNIRGSMDYTDFWINRVEMFLKWNRQDPPDANERRRNDLVEAFQCNRNPFTDDYTLADKVGALVFKSH